MAAQGSVDSGIIVCRGDSSGSIASRHLPELRAGPEKNMNPVITLLSTLSNSLPDISIPGVTDIVGSVPLAGAIPIKLIIGIAVAIAAAWTYRETLAHALDERRDQVWWAGKYLLILLGGFLVGRQLGAAVGSSPGEWLATVTAAVGGHKRIAGAVLVAVAIVAYDQYQNSEVLG